MTIVKLDLAAFAADTGAHELWLQETLLPAIQERDPEALTSSIKLLKSDAPGSILDDFIAEVPYGKVKRFTVAKQGQKALIHLEDYIIPSNDLLIIQQLTQVQETVDMILEALAQLEKNDTSPDEPDDDGISDLATRLRTRG